VTRVIPRDRRAQASAGVRQYMGSSVGQQYRQKVPYARAKGEPVLWVRLLPQQCGLAQLSR